MTPSPHLARGLGWVLVSILCWVPLFPVAKRALPIVDAFALGSIRYAIGSVLFVGLLVVMEGKRALRYDGRWEESSRIADRAAERGRPVAATMITSARDRLLLRPGYWTASGLVYVNGERVRVDTARTRQMAGWIQRELGARSARESIDPVNRYFRRMLNCPRQMLDSAILADTSRLDSVCNYR